MDLNSLVHVYVPSTVTVPYGAVYRYYPGGTIDCWIVYYQEK